MLLDEIITLLSTPSANLTEALLKTKILLYQINKKELAGWINNELNGYPKGAELPPYRIVNARVLANFSGLRFRATSHPIPIGHLTAEQRQNLETAKMFESLAVIENLTSGEEPRVTEAIPMELNPLLGKRLAPGTAIESAWCELNIHEIENIVIQVRSRLLDFLLELKSSIGSGDTDAALMEKAKTFDTTSMFNNAVFGGNTTIVVGDHNVQAVRIDNTAGDLPALERTLSSIGIPSDEIVSLKAAIAEDQATGQKPSLAGKPGKWFTELLAKAGKGTVKVGVDIISSAAVKAMTNYFGG